MVNNAGTWEKTVGTNTSTISAAFNNTGTVNVQSGTLDLTGGGTDVGATYEGSGTVQFGGGTRTLDTTSSIVGNALFSGGQTTVNGGTGTGLMTVNGGTATFNGAVTTGALTQSGGVLNGSGTLTVSGAASFTATSSIESGTGTTLVEGGASFATGGNNLNVALSRTLELQGTSTVTGAVGGTIGLGTGGILKLDSGATFNDESNGLSISGTTGMVNNAGTWEKTVGTNTSTISAVFNNTGTVNVQSGTLDLAGGGTDVGATYEGSGTVQFGGGTRTLDATSSIVGNALFSGGQTTVNGGTGTGLMTVNGGTATFNGAVTTGALTQSGGVLNGSGTLTVSGAASFTATSSIESGTGTTLVEGGASFATGGNNLSVTLSRILELEGTSTVTGIVGGTIGLGTSGILKLDSGATFNDESGTTTGGTGLSISGTTGTVNNAGTWEKTVGTNTSTISAVFNNTGTVDVQSGTLKLAGAVTNTGLLKADGGTLFVAGAINGGSGEISGSSVLEFGGASSVNITFDPGSTGMLKVDGTVGYGGTISGLALGNYVDLTNVQYFGSTFQPIYVANSTNTGGTLEVVTSVNSGVATYGALLTLSDPTGSYTASSFVESSDGHGGALITDPPVASVPNGATVSSTSGQSGSSTTAAALTSPITVADGSTIEINSPYTGQVSFQGPIGTGILQLDNSANFNGTVAGMIGQDAIDLRDINFAANQKTAFSGSETSGTLSVGDGVHTANIQLLGNYIAAAFTTASDGHGGTFVEAQPHPVAMLSSSHA